MAQDEGKLLGTIELDPSGTGRVLAYRTAVGYMVFVRLPDGRLENPHLDARPSIAAALRMAKHVWGDRVWGWKDAGRRTARNPAHRAAPRTTRRPATPKRRADGTFAPKRRAR